MTFRKSKQAVICAVTASWLVLCIASPSAAQAEDSEADAADGEGASKEGSGKEKKKSRLNSVRLSGAYAFHLLRDRDSAVTGEPLHTREHLGGFEVAYERELIEDHLSLELGFDYVYLPTDPVVTHGFDVALGGVYHF